MRGAAGNMSPLKYSSKVRSIQHTSPQSSSSEVLRHVGLPRQPSLGKRRYSFPDAVGLNNPSTCRAPCPAQQSIHRTEPVLSYPPLETESPLSSQDGHAMNTLSLNHG